MRQLIMALICAFFFSSCAGVMPGKPVEVLFSTQPSSLAEFAVSNYPPNKVIKVMRDTILPTRIVEIPFYSSCKQRLVEMQRTSNVGEANQGVLYVNERNCEMVSGTYVAGFIYILTSDVHSNDHLWVSAPCLLFAGDKSERIEVAKEYITLNPTGNGEYIFIQK